jgi:CheY-like chemotaxis protein
LLLREQGDTELVRIPRLQDAIAALSQTPAQALVINAAVAEQPSPGVRWTDALPYGTPAIICHLPDEAELSEQLGVARYLLKPVTRERLLSAVEEVSPPAGTVLIVDDEPEALQLFARMLSAGNRYRVVRALDGASALDLARSRQPDVMLLDLVMPGMNGLDVLQAKAGDPAVRGIPVVAITAQDLIQGPVFSSEVTITRGGGLSAGDLLRCIQGITGTLPARRCADRREREGEPHE